MSGFTVFYVVLVFMLSLRFAECKPRIKVFSVMNFGAVRNSRTDDTNAFLKAWSAACSGTLPRGVIPQVQVPSGKTFLVKQLSFNGPCKSSSIQFLVRGNIFAPISPSQLRGAHTWITFENVNGLTVNGDGIGVINGRGSAWWKTSPSEASRPTALLFSRCDNLVVHGLKHVDSPKNHVKFMHCNNVDVFNLKIVAPQTSPNTDGIDVSRCQHVNIRDSVIGTGDDCIAIGNGNNFININSIYCGPGHGISIGSLGRNGETSIVEEIHVKNVTFDRTQNGARIKSWQGGSGYARKISFQDVILKGTDKPIFIDQYYCPHRTDCKNETKAVQISDISFVGFKGTSRGKDAIILNCSKSVACTNIYVNNIDIAGGKETSCINAHGKSGNSVNPKVNCLLK